MVREMRPERVWMPFHNLSVSRVCLMTNLLVHFISTALCVYVRSFARTFRGL